MAALLVSVIGTPEGEQAIACSPRARHDLLNLEVDSSSSATSAASLFAGREAANFARWTLRTSMGRRLKPSFAQALREPNPITPEVSTALTGLDERLMATLRSGDIRLLRSDWLLQRPKGYRLPPRQELEKSHPEAFLSVDDIRALPRGHAEDVARCQLQHQRARRWGRVAGCHRPSHGGPRLSGRRKGAEAVHVSAPEARRTRPLPDQADDLSDIRSWCVRLVVVVQVRRQDVAEGPALAKGEPLVPE